MAVAQLFEEYVENNAMPGSVSELQNMFVLVCPCPRWVCDRDWPRHCLRRKLRSRCRKGGGLREVVLCGHEGHGTPKIVTKVGRNPRNSLVIFGLNMFWTITYDTIWYHESTYGFPPVNLHLDISWPWAAVGSSPCLNRRLTWSALGSRAQPCLVVQPTFLKWLGHDQSCEGMDRVIFGEHGVQYVYDMKGEEITKSSLNQHNQPPKMLIPMVVPSKSATTPRWPWLDLMKACCWQKLTLGQP